MNIINADVGVVEYTRPDGATMSRVARHWYVNARFIGIGEGRVATTSRSSQRCRGAQGGVVVQMVLIPHEDQLQVRRRAIRRQHQG